METIRTSWHYPPARAPAPFRIRSPTRGELFPPRPASDLVLHVFGSLAINLPDYPHSTKVQLNLALDQCELTPPGSSGWAHILGGRVA